MREIPTMSTVTELDLFRGRHHGVPTTRNVQRQPVNPGSDLRALWSDTLATLAIVSLVFIVVFEALRIAVW
jgi:hypothetical protein